RLDANAEPVEPYFDNQYARGVTAALAFSQPIFTAGLARSKVRQAVDLDSQARLDVDVQRRSVVQSTAQAWAQLVSTRQALGIENRQVEVERESVKGNQIEERVGQRTTIELLNAELELTESRVTLVQGRRDEYVARATLLASMGLLEIDRLVPAGQVAVYDPSADLRNVIGKGVAPWEGAVHALDVGPRAAPPAKGETSVRPPGAATLPSVPDTADTPPGQPIATAPHAG
ncbi:MAG TPA: TolC family protein, partial [Chloroflexota bacterium]